KSRSAGFVLDRVQEAARGRDGDPEDVVLGGLATLEGKLRDKGLNPVLLDEPRVQTSSRLEGVLRTVFVDQPLDQRRARPLRARTAPGPACHHTGQNKESGEVSHAIEPIRPCPMPPRRAAPTGAHRAPLPRAMTRGV